MTDDIPLHWLFSLLAALLISSGFFSMSETCMMALNRYRLRHLVKQGSRGARFAQSLLDKTEELLSFILAGNTVMNADQQFAKLRLLVETAREVWGDD